MFSKITPNIYVSGMNEVQNIDHLKSLGINAILNVAWEVTDPNYAPQDFLMVKIGLLDSQGNPDYLKSMAVLALHNLLENGCTVLVHCAAGASRSPYVAFRYLAEKEQRTIEAVYAEFLPQYPGMTVSPLNYAV